MTPAQLQRLIDNRRRDWMFQPLSVPAERILKDASRAGRRRRQAQEAWEKLAPPDLCAGGRVVEVSDGVVVIAADGAARERIRRISRKIAGQMAACVVGVRDIRVE